MAVIKKISLTLFLILLQIQNVLAESKYRVKTIYNNLKQAGDGGAQVIDDKGTQEMTVNEPTVLMSMQIDETYTISGSYVSDTWTSASDTAFDDYTSQSSRETKDHYERKGQTLSFSMDKKKYGSSVTLGQSDEFDYKSNYITLSGFKTFADDNFTLGGSYSYYDDESQLYDILAEESFDFEDKKTRAYSIDMSQILTPVDLLLFGYTRIEQNGPLEGSVNSVSIDDIRKNERLPNSKTRNAIYGKWIHSIAEDKAIHTSYRYYTDSWNMQAHTIELSYLNSFKEEDAYVELFYRYYTQTELQYYKDKFDAARDFMTSDSDLEGLSSTHLGAYYYHDIYFNKFLMNLVFGVTDYRRSNDLSFQTVQVGLGVEF